MLFCFHVALSVLPNDIRLCEEDGSGLDHYGNTTIGPWTSSQCTIQGNIKEWDLQRATPSCAWLPEQTYLTKGPETWMVQSLSFDDFAAPSMRWVWKGEMNMCGPHICKFHRFFNVSFHVGRYCDTAPLSSQLLCQSPGSCSFTEYDLTLAVGAIDIASLVLDPGARICVDPYLIYPQCAGGTPSIIEGKATTICGVNDGSCVDTIVAGHQKEHQEFSHEWDQCATLNLGGGLSGFKKAKWSFAHDGLEVVAQLDLYEGDQCEGISSRYICPVRRACQIGSSSFVFGVDMTEPWCQDERLVYPSCVGAYYSPSFWTLPRILGVAAGGCVALVAIVIIILCCVNRKNRQYTYKPLVVSGQELPDK